MKISLDILPPIMFQIPFDINKHLAPQGRMPSEFDKENLPEPLYISLINEYNQKNDSIMFSNVEFEYEYCDCEYPCSHQPWVSGFNVTTNSNFRFYFEDESQLVVETKKSHTVLILNFDMAKFTVGDFHRILKIHNIDLHLSHYALALMSTEKISRSQWLKFNKLNLNIPLSTTINKAFEILEDKYKISLKIYNRYLTDIEIGFSTGFKLPIFDNISDLSNGVDDKNDGVISLDFDVARKRSLTYLLNYLLSDKFQYHSGSMELSWNEWKKNKRHVTFYKLFRLKK
jgi:hypothetical protein